MSTLKKLKQFAALKTQKYTWDATVDGGTKNTSISIGTLPANSMIVGGWAYINTTPVGDTTTLALGYTSATTAFSAATTATSLTGGTYLRLAPGVINIGSGQAITTVDTPAEAIAYGRVSSDTFGALALTANKEVLVTLSNDSNLTAGKITVFIEYYLVS